MKKHILFLLSLSLLCYCSAQRYNVAFIEMKITNNLVNDRETVNILFTNHTNQNYYLPLDFTDNYYSFYKIEGGIDEKLYFLQERVTNKDNNFIALWGIFDSGSIDEKVKNYSSEIYEYFRGKNVSDMVLLKSGETKKFSLYFYSKVKSDVTSYTMEYDLVPNEKYFLSYKYQVSYSQLKESLLNKRVLDSLEVMGYKLYEKEIISNKIPINLKPQ